MIEIFKITGPFLLFSYFVLQVMCKRGQKLLVAMLFFTSISAFSQNFTFVYREIHQVIQLIIMFYSILLLSQKKKLSSTVLPLIVFLFFVLLSVVISGLDTDAKSQLINYIVVFFVTIFLFDAISNKKNFYDLLAFIGNLGVILSVITILEFLFTGNSRCEATFANPNYLALFLGVSFSLIAYGKSKLKIIYLLTIIFAILLTGSRSAMLIPLIVFAWNIWKDRLSYKTVLTVITGICLFFVILTSENSRFNSDGIDGSDIERIQFAIVAYKMTIDHPITGVGWGRFIAEFSNYSKNIDPVRVESGGEVDVSKQERRVTHNDILRIASELGLIALTFVIFFIFKCFNILVIRKAYGFDFLVPVWFGFLVFSLTHNNLNTAFSWFFLLMPFFIYKKRWSQV